MDSIKLKILDAAITAQMVEDQQTGTCSIEEACTDGMTHPLVKLRAMTPEDQEKYIAICGLVADLQTIAGNMARGIR